MVLEHYIIKIKSFFNELKCVIYKFFAFLEWVVNQITHDVFPNTLKILQNSRWARPAHKKTKRHVSLSLVGAH